MAQKGKQPALRKAFFVIGLLLVCSLAQGQGSYRFQPMYLGNFAKYIQWPSGAGSSNFEVGVFGNSNVVSSFVKTLNGRVVNNKKILVKKYSSPQSIGSGTMVVFLSKGSNYDLGDILAKTKGKPILVVTEEPGLAQKGSMINFVMRGGKMKFELNKETAEATGLKVSRNLVAIAINV